MVFVMGGNSVQQTQNNPPEDEEETYTPGQQVPIKIRPPKTTTSKAKKAIEQGVTYLKKRLLGSEKLYYHGDGTGPHVGAAALAGLTLLECGVSPDHPAVNRAVEIVYHGEENFTGKSGEIRYSYSLALSVLFLDGLVNRQIPDTDKSKHKAKIRRLALQLIAAQHDIGGWGYHCQTLSHADEQRLLNQLNTGTFRPGKFEVVGGYQKPYRDNSIAQFATLALWSARKHGIPVTRSLLLEEQRYRKSQREDGSWNYRDPVEDELGRVIVSPVDTQRDATTCAGLIGLAIGRAIREEAKEAQGPKGNKKSAKKYDITKEDKQIRKGLEFVGRVIGMEDKLPTELKLKRHRHTEKLDHLNKQLLEARGGAHAKDIQKKIRQLDNDELATGILFGSDAWGDLYFLWCVERMAMVYGLDKIEGKDWYKWGAEIIIKNQQQDGSWKERFPGVPDTCFALLFLKRANVVQDLTDKLRSLMARLNQPGPALQNHPVPVPDLPPVKEV